jgi:hypothetical protein
MMDVRLSGTRTGSCKRFDRVREWSSSSVCTSGFGVGAGKQPFPPGPKPPRGGALLARRAAAAGSSQEDCRSGGECGVGFGQGGELGRMDGMTEYMYGSVDKTTRPSTTSSFVRILPHLARGAIVVEVPLLPRIPAVRRRRCNEGVRRKKGASKQGSENEDGWIQYFTHHKDSQPSGRLGAGGTGGG